MTKRGHATKRNEAPMRVGGSTSKRRAEDQARAPNARSTAPSAAGGLAGDAAAHMPGHEPRTAPPSAAPTKDALRRQAKAGATPAGTVRGQAGRETKFQRAERLRDALERFEDLPNASHATAGDLRLLGLRHARDLRGADPRALHERLEHLTGSRQDPCVLDVFRALVDFVDGAPARPWWHYTAARKRMPGG